LNDVEWSIEDDGRDDRGDDPAGLASPGRPGSELPMALVVATVLMVSVAVLAGWLGYRTWQCHQAEQERALFLRVARQSAADLTTINHSEVEADVQRILDSSTGSFYDDFSKRRQPFVDRIKRDRSTSEGTVTEVGLLNMTNYSARALVAVSVKLSTAGSTEPKLDGFRLRIDLQRAGDGAKISDVEYVQ
jgi:Mce-associated membrane protein